MKTPVRKFFFEWGVLNIGNKNEVKDTRLEFGNQTQILIQ